MKKSYDMKKSYQIPKNFDHSPKNQPEESSSEDIIIGKYVPEIMNFYKTIEVNNTEIGQSIDNHSLRSSSI